MIFAGQEKHTLQDVIWEYLTTCKANQWAKKNLKVKAMMKENSITWRFGENAPLLRYSDTNHYIV